MRRGRAVQGWSDGGRRGSLRQACVHRHEVMSGDPFARRDGRGVARARAYAVHAYTASGIVPVLFAAIEIGASAPRPGVALAWLVAAAVIDATDGPLARRWNVARVVPAIRGRTMDDIIDYLSYTFLPLLLVWRMEWVASPRALWVSLALIASLFGFANVKAKEDELGFFVGFPSYWNVVAFYCGIWATRFGVLAPTVLVVALAALTLAPMRFVYPNRAAAPWNAVLALGGTAWIAALLIALPRYPHVPDALWIPSLAYPALYVAASVRLARRAAGPGG